MHPYRTLWEVVEKDTAKDLVSTACVPGWGTTEVRSPAWPLTCGGEDEAVSHHVILSLGTNLCRCVRRKLDLLH